mmetsp:Transcript_60714/g.166730  ORF Transcript_60714/g.166730 Transcript_60714/m.166730 type:complete len:274 (-) Transcript_60714:144-965(-)
MGVHENLLLRRHVEHHAHRARRVYDLTLVRVVNVLTGLLRIEAMDPIQIKVDVRGRRGDLLRDNRRLCERDRVLPRGGGLDVDGKTLRLDRHLAHLARVGVHGGEVLDRAGEDPGAVVHQLCRHLIRRIEHLHPELVDIAKVFEPAHQLGRGGTEFEELLPRDHGSVDRLEIAKRLDGNVLDIGLKRRVDRRQLGQTADGGAEGQDHLVHTEQPGLVEVKDTKNVARLLLRRHTTDHCERRQELQCVHQVVLVVIEDNEDGFGNIVELFLTIL